MILEVVAIAVIDTNDNTTTRIDSLRARGVTAVGRYYSSSAWKRLTKPEAKALSEAGIQLFTVFENSGDPELSVQQGLHDAQIALQQATQVAQPEGSAIYFAMEHLPNGYDASHVPGIKNYFSGLKQVLGDRYKLGVYSDGVVCDALLSSGACEYAWLSASTAFPGSKEFDRSGRWTLAQRRVDLDWSGLSVDTNDAKPNFGAFLVGAAVPAAVAMAAEAPSIPQSGWTLLVRRLRTEKRDSEPFARTVGQYQVYVDGAPVADLRGMTVEREGPGDNGPVGKADHRCIEAGTYPLRGHDTENYTTVGFEPDGNHPRPALEVGDTDARVGILIHPASGYGSTIGCINLAGSLVGPDSDFSLSDSTARVIALINDLKGHNGGTLPKEGAIVDCRLVVVDPPIDQIGRQSLRLGSRGPLVKAWQAFLAVQGFNIGAGGADGSFGAATSMATLAFQNAHGLAGDGTVGPRTIAAAVQLGFSAPSPAVARAQAPVSAGAMLLAAAGGGVPTFDAPLPGIVAGMAAAAMTVPIHALRVGATGPLVKAWQSFLTGQDFDPGGLDGYFGDKTQAATVAFQAAHGLKADGVAGQQTLNAAIALGFQLIDEPDTDDTGSNFPPRPSFPSLQSTRQRWAIFGQFDYVPAPTRDNPERIRILGSWEADNIIDVPIPQLARTGIPGAPATIRFHRLARAQLQALWAAWESANLLDLILTYDDSFAPRFKRGQANGGDEALSNHAFGSAFDINEPSNKFGTMPALVGKRGSVRKLVPIANEHGFYWGGHFSNPDGMHFEVASLTSSVVA